MHVVESTAHARLEVDTKNPNPPQQSMEKGEHDE